MRVDWVGESCSESITLCGVEGEDIGTGQTLCPDCAQVADFEKEESWPGVDKNRFMLRH